MGEDISKKTITYLMIFALFVSVLGSIFVLTSINKAQEPTMQQQSDHAYSSQAGVKLAIDRPSTPQAETASVALQIERKGGN